jgi:tetratricopeptide (TPR) repeat protein
VIKKITIRPGYLPYLLSGAVALTAGSTLIGNGLLKQALICWALLLPIAVVAILDRIELDNKAITHKGPLAFLLSLAFGTQRRLAIADIEAITTETLSFSFASGDTRITYHTRISGSGFEVSVRSHRAAYVSFIKALFRLAGPHKLDPRSHELFEYFESGKDVKNFPLLKNEIETMPPSLLRRIGNSLRLAGRLSQASSYFRIAYEKEPRNPELLYEMSRFLRSSAQTRDPRMLQRSDACLRLASRLAREAPDLLERIGEVFFERLDYKRAADCFRRALEFDASRFRANVGLAEIALRDGKLAHVAHYYNAASASEDLALAKLARREAGYYQRLMSDDDFLETELRRIRAVNQVRWARKLSALIFLSAWTVGSILGRFVQPVQRYGWALMATSGLVWCVCAIALQYFRNRRSQPGE